LKVSIHSAPEIPYTFQSVAHKWHNDTTERRRALADIVHQDTTLTNTPDIMQQWKEMILKPASNFSRAMVGPTLIVIEA
jgi:hypothetical protein